MALTECIKVIPRIIAYLIGVVSSGTQRAKLATVL